MGWRCFICGTYFELPNWKLFEPGDSEEVECYYCIDCHAIGRVPKQDDHGIEFNKESED